MAYRYAPLPVIFALAVTLTMPGCMEQAEQPRLEFSTGACTQDINPYTPPEAGILETIWEDESTLRVNGFVTTYCGGAEISGDSAVDGRDITLFYSITTSGPVTSCLCTRGVRYRIMGISRGEYRVVMEKR
jgi:hypothetical protein